MISGIVIRAASSICASASTKGTPRRTASLRPTDDFPAPIMPTSTTERHPSAATMALSASGWEPDRCRTVSGMMGFRKLTQWPRIPFRAQSGGASCHRGRNVVVVNGAYRAAAGLCPASAVRDTWQHPLTRTSEARGHQQAYVSAALDLKFLNEIAAGGVGTSNRRH